MQIVDLSLLVRRDMQATVDDPFQQAMPPVCVNHDNTLGLQPNSVSSAIKSPSRTGSPGGVGSNSPADTHNDKTI